GSLTSTMWILPRVVALRSATIPPRVISLFRHPDELRVRERWQSGIATSGLCLHARWFLGRQWWAGPLPTASRRWVEGPCSAAIAAEVVLFFLVAWLAKAVSPAPKP